MFVVTRAPIFCILQLEEKTRRLRELETASHLWEGRIRQLEKQKLELETKVAQTRQALDEHVARLSKQVTFVNMFFSGVPCVNKWKQ